MSNVSDTEVPTVDRKGRHLNEEEQNAIIALRERTDEAWNLKKRYSECAQERRDAITILREKKWSFRDIGETIGVSGQRIDSMLRLGDAKFAASDVV